MKNVLNYLVKPMLLLVLIAFTGCEKELYEDGLQNGSRKLTVKKISLKDIEKKTSAKISEQISKFTTIKSKSTSQGRVEYNSSLNIYIDTDNGKLVEMDEKEYYTFPMFKTDETDLQNVLFETKDDGSMQAYFIKYNVTPEEFNELTNEEIQNLDSEYQKILSADGTSEYICVDLYSVETEYNSFELNEGNGNPSSSSSVVTFVASFCNWVEGQGNSIGIGGGGTGGNTSGGHTGGGTNGGVASSPTGLSPEQLKMKDFVKNLTNEQEAWYVAQPPEIQNNVTNYLISTNFSLVSKEFIIDCINEINEDPNDELNSITPFLIVRKINDIALNPCSKAVFQQIKNTTNNNFVTVLSKLNAEETTYNTTMISAVAPSGTGIGQTIRSSAYNYTIYISTNYSDKTKLMIAHTILHELIHAYFFSLIDDCHLQNSCELLSTYPELWEYFVNHSNSIYPSNSISHHEEIANSYVSAIASALEEFQPGLPTQVYEDLAWSGLEDTNIFNTLHPVGSASRERILNRKAAEQTGHAVGQGTPQEQTNYGQPCN